MNIKNITLADGGLKGLQIIYNEPDKQGSKLLVSDIKKKRRHPIHLGLEIPFKDLRYHLLYAYSLIRDGMTKHDIDVLVEQCEITGVDLDPEYFMIKGTLGSFGDKSVSLATAKVQEDDGYEHFDAVINILKTIIEETKLYLAGDVKVDDNEIVFRWIGAGKEKEFDLDSFNSLPDEEKKVLCQEILEKNFGATVLMEEDISFGEAAEESDSIELSMEAETIILPAK